MDIVIPALPFATALLAGMLVCLWIGRRLGLQWLNANRGTIPSRAVVEGAVFSLFGLLLAFAFSGAPGRLDARKRLVAEEANAIASAYLRLDLLAEEAQPALRGRFREYVESRIETYRSPDMDAAQPKLLQSEKIQKDIWEKVVNASNMKVPFAEALRPPVVTAVNEMINIAGVRNMAARIHPPTIIFALLFIVALVCSVLAGHGMSANPKRSWLHIASFVVIPVVSVFVILEIEYPRMGFVNLENDQALVEVLNKMQ